MTKIKYAFIFMFLTSLLCAQNQHVETEISSPRVFDLSVIRVYPDSFPQVSVIFQAKNNLGKPLWLLSKEELRINENNKECQVIRLKDISKNKPLNIAMVLDHSGSMVDNPLQMPDTVETYQDLYFENLLPEGYVMPIDYAKKALFDFCNTNEAGEDSLLFVGFSSFVDPILPLTADFRSVQELLKDINPVGSTAFFDALYYSIDSLRRHTSQPVIIALTDGADNRSVHNVNEIVNYAVDNNVAIYIIGLGKAESKTLQYISEKTKGFYYYTNDPGSLSEIYLNIKKQIRSIYQVDYLSNATYSEMGTEGATLRNIEFVFKNDTLSFSPNSTEYTLPPEAVKYVKEQDEIRKAKIAEEQKEEILLYSSIGGAILLGTFTFILIRKRRKGLPEIKKAFPNPFTDVLNVEYSIPLNTAKGVLTITDMNGLTIYRQDIALLTSTSEFNLSELKSGTYLLQIETESDKSNTLKVIKK